MIDKLPTAWAPAKFEDVCDIISGKNQKDVVIEEGEFPIYGSGGIMGYAKEYLCNEGTTIIGRKGTINSPIYVEEKFWNVDTAFGLSPNFIYNSKLFYFYCKSFNFKNLDKSTTIPSLAKTDLLQIEIPLPPLAEQHRIVAKIEELFSSLDKGIETLKTAQQQLKVYRQAVLKWAFEGRLTHPDLKEGELPEGWVKKSFGELISISSGEGLTKSARNELGTFNVYGGNGLSGKHDNYLFEEEQLIIGRVGAHCGNTHITTPKSWVTDNAFIVEFDSNKLDIKFLFHLIRFNDFNKLSSSTAQPVISQGKIYPVKAALPVDIEKQRNLVQEIESRLSVCDKIEESITQSLQQAEALRQSILKKAFEGKLVPQDPNDEPASVLLERIRAEREHSIVRKTLKEVKNKKYQDEYYSK